MPAARRHSANRPVSNSIAPPSRSLAQSRFPHIVKHHTAPTLRTNDGVRVAACNREQSVRYNT